MKLLNNLFPAKYESGFKNRCYRKGGKVIWVEWFNSVLKNKKGAVVRIMSLMQDITANKELEDRINRTNHLYNSISRINQDYRLQVEIG